MGFIFPPKLFSGTLEFPSNKGNSLFYSFFRFGHAGIDRWPHRLRSALEGRAGLVRGFRQSGCNVTRIIGLCVAVCRGKPCQRHEGTGEPDTGNASPPDSASAGTRCIRPPAACIDACLFAHGAYPVSRCGTPRDWGQSTMAGPPQRRPVRPPGLGGNAHSDKGPYTKYTKFSCCRAPPLRGFFTRPPSVQYTFL